MNNGLDLAKLLYSKQPQMPGTGLAKQAADDKSLRPLWIQAQEQMAMGEMPTMDYATWKAMKLKEMSQPR